MTGRHRRRNGAVTAITAARARHGTIRSPRLSRVRRNVRHGGRSKHRRCGVASGLHPHVVMSGMRSMRRRIVRRFRAVMRRRPGYLRRVLQGAVIVPATQSQRGRRSGKNERDRGQDRYRAPQIPPNSDHVHHGSRIEKPQ